MRLFIWKEFWRGYKVCSGTFWQCAAFNCHSSALWMIFSFFFLLLEYLYSVFVVMSWWYLANARYALDLPFHPAFLLFLFFNVLYVSAHTDGLRCIQRLEQSCVSFLSIKFSLLLTTLICSHVILNALHHLTYDL